MKAHNSMPYTGLRPQEDFNSSRNANETEATHIVPISQNGIEIENQNLNEMIENERHHQISIRRAENEDIQRKKEVSACFFFFIFLLSIALGVSFVALSANKKKTLDDVVNSLSAINNSINSNFKEYNKNNDVLDISKIYPMKGNKNYNHPCVVGCSILLYKYDDSNNNKGNNNNNNGFEGHIYAHIPHIWLDNEVSFLLVEQITKGVGE